MKIFACITWGVLLLPIAAHGEPTRTSVSDRGTLQVNGEDRFLFGMYHVSWMADPTLPGKASRRYAERDEDLKTIAGVRGLNAVTASLDPGYRYVSLSINSAGASPMAPP